MPLELTSQEISKFVPVAAGYEPEAYQDYITQVEEDYLMPEIGEELYEAIISSDDYPERLKKMIIRAACHLAWAQFTPFQEVVINNTGIVQHRSDTEVVAKSETVQRVQDTFQETGFKELEKALQFIEKNADEELYQGWKNGKAYALAQELLIPNLTTFETALSLGGSRRLFARVIPSIRTTEFLQFEPLLTADLYQDLKANPSTTANRVLLEKLIIPALSRFALSSALPNLAIVFGYDTVLNFENTGAGFTKAYRSTPAEEVRNLASQLHAQAKEIYDQILPYLLENKAKYPAFTPSAPIGIIPRPDNSNSTICSF